MVFDCVYFGGIWGVVFSFVDFWLNFWFGDLIRNFDEFFVLKNIDV